MGPDGAGRPGSLGSHRALPARLPRKIRLELAKVGLADNGTPVRREILDEIVETFPSVGDAPAIIGHLRSDKSPRFGSVKSAEKVGVRGGEVYASDVELHDVLADAYDEGFFPKWSLGAKRRPSDGKYILHHLAFLGAVPPAVKNLKVFEMDGVELGDDGDLVTIELSDPTAPPPTQPPDDPATPVATNKTDDTKTPATTEEVEKKIADEAAAENERQAKAPADGETLEQMKARVAKMEAELARREKREGEALVAQTKEAVRGQPLDVQAAAVELADRLVSGADIIELSDGDGTVEATPAEGFLRFLKTLRPPVDAGVMDLGDLPARTKVNDDDRPAPASSRQVAQSI